MMTGTQGVGVDTAGRKGWQRDTVKREGRQGGTAGRKGQQSDMAGREGLESGTAASEGRQGGAVGRGGWRGAGTLVRLGALARPGALVRPGTVAAAYLAGLLVWFPLWIGSYTQVSEVKLTAFLGVTLLCVCLAAFAPQSAGSTKPVRGVWGAGGAAVAAFAVAAAVSTLCSAEPFLSLWAYEGYLGGLVLVLGCAAGYFLLCGYLPGGAGSPLPGIGLLFMGSGAVVAALGVLNDFGIDPLGLTRDIDPVQRNIFFSTIGNVDYLNSFFCLWLPFTCWQWLRGRRRSARGVALGCAAVGLLAVAALDPGITALGTAFAILVFLCVVPLSAQDWRRLCVLAALWFLAQGLLFQLDKLWPLLMWERPFALLGSPPAAAAGVLLALLAAWRLGRVREPERACPRALLFQRIAAAAAVLTAVVLFGVVNGLGISLGALDNFFRLGPAWCTGRGAIWADVTALFAAAPPLRKLVGFGPGMLYRALQTTPGLPYALADTIGAHCEYLHELACGGLVGFAVRLALPVAHLVPALRGAGKSNDERLGWALAVCAYSGQAVFNNRVAAVFPLFVAVLALTRVTADAPNDPGSPRAGAAAAGYALVLFAAGTALAGVLFTRML